MSTTATLTNTNVTEPHIPTVNSAFAALTAYTFVSGAGGAYIASSTDALAALNALYLQVVALTAELTTNRQMISAT